MKKTKNHRILLVEDDQSMVTLIKYNLEMEGYRFTSMRNGREALGFCKKQPPDLIISDISMPEMDGFEFREELIKNEQLQKIPFMFITAKVQADDKMHGLQLGVTHFLIKPFEPELLLLTVADILTEKNE